MLEGTKKIMYCKCLFGKRLYRETESVVTRIRLESCLLDGKVNKHDRNDRENKHNQSGFKCLIINPAKKNAPAWSQLETRKTKQDFHVLKGSEFNGIDFWHGRKKHPSYKSATFSPVLLSSTTQTLSAFLDCN